MSTQRKLAATWSRVFSFRKPTPIKIIIDVDDVDYYIKRADEFIMLINDAVSVNMVAETTLAKDQYVDYLTQAILLLEAAKTSLEKS